MLDILLHEEYEDLVKVTANPPLVSYILMSWEISWLEEAGSLQSIGSQRIRYN